MRRLPRTIDKPIELLGFRVEEIGIFVSVLVVFLLVDWFLVGLLVSTLILAFIREARRGKPEGHILHLAYRSTGVPLGKLLPSKLRKLSG